MESSKNEMDIVTWLILYSEGRESHRHEEAAKEISKLRVKLSETQKRLDEAERVMVGLLPEIYCLYQQATGERLDRNYDETCVVHRKYKKARDYQEKYKTAESGK